MFIYLLVGRRYYSSLDEIEVVDAVDEYSVDANPDLLYTMKNGAGPDFDRDRGGDLKFVRIAVSFKDLKDLFEIPEVESSDLEPVEG